MRALLPFAALFITCAACVEPPLGEAGVAPFVAVTFNSGTTAGVLGDDDVDNGGYHEAQAAISDEHYGDGLAWAAAVDDTARFFAELSPDVVVFQEMFHASACPSIPEEARAGFVCESWQPGDPAGAHAVLGDAYQVACNLGKPDKCTAIHERFGSIRGCEGELCFDALDGGEVDDCGGGSRVGRAVIDLVGGGTLDVVNVHGTSGFKEEDMACRVRQFEQVFVDLLDGSGAPAANGERNLILGDLNTDPGRLYGADPSADVFNAHVNLETPFSFVSDIGKDVTPSYAGLFNIDHVVSDALAGSCVSAGTEGTPAVTELRYFDHKPLVCSIEQR